MHDVQECHDENWICICVHEYPFIANPAFCLGIFRSACSIECILTCYQHQSHLLLHFTVGPKDVLATSIIIRTINLSYNEVHGFTHACHEQQIQTCEYKNVIRNRPIFMHSMHKLWCNISHNQISLQMLPRSMLCHTGWGWLAMATKNLAWTCSWYWTVCKGIYTDL